MHYRALLSVFAVLALSSPATARLNETPDRCALRYGEPIEEKEGAGWVLWTRVYERAPFRIAVMFYRKPYGPVKAGCILYEKRDPVPESALTRSAAMNEEETNALLGTVPGLWTSYERKSRLVEPDKSEGKRISDGNTIPKKIRDNASSLVSLFWRALIPTGTQGGGMAIESISHNGTRAFAFRRYHTLILVSHEGIEALESWKKEEESRPVTRQTPPLPKGF